VGERSLTAQRIIWLIAAVSVGIAVSGMLPDTILMLLFLGALAFGCLISPLAAMAIMLGAAPLRTLIATEAPQLLPVDIGQFSVAVLLISWLLRLLIQRRTIRESLPTSPVVATLGIFVFASGLSVFSAVSTQAWLTEWLKWIQISLIVIVVLDVCRNDGITWLVFALVSAALANAIVGIYEYYGGSGALHLLVEERFFRAFGTFGQPNPFGGFMGLVIPIALMAALAWSLRLWEQRTVSIRIPSNILSAVYFTLSAGVLCYALYVSWSRGAWLGFAASLAAVIVALPRRTWLSLGIASAGLVMVVLVFSSGLLPASIANRLSSITNEISATGDVRGVDITPENYANVERLAHWQAAVNMATSNPWLGIGFGNYENAYKDFSLLHWNLPLGHAHNYYLNVVAETGMIGALSYGCMMVAVIFLTWRIRKHPDTTARLISIGLLGSWIYLAVHSLTDNLYVNNMFLHIGILFALVAVLHDQLFRESHGIG
jgi:putative inorganic carbon (hco3(-)) transporter